MSCIADFLFTRPRRKKIALPLPSVIMRISIVVMSLFVSSSLVTAASSSSSTQTTRRSTRKSKRPNLPWAQDEPYVRPRPRTTSANIISDRADFCAEICLSCLTCSTNWLPSWQSSGHLRRYVRLVPYSHFTRRASLLLQSIYGHSRVWLGYRQSR